MAEPRLTLQAQPLDATLTALADPARRRTIELLREEPRRSSDLAEALGLSRPLMSRHLKVLRKAGLVEERAAEHDARNRVYRLKPERFTELRGWVEEVEAFWNEQLGAFAEYAEAKLGKR
ncbi:MAG: winged helix-turn-helix transcriptional regulator [Myxococcales bacterium]|nr:winged helix-turn-helix transcriptional regulator [Myxococcales bacterium]MCB9608341.1 winged helix-turn-helix transcriptional regulator [Polyangiaceae bacterium]